MTLDRALLERLRIEPLDRNRHDRAAFSCGVDRVDNFLKSTAARQQDRDLTRVYVALRAESNVILGYYALNAHAIAAAILPPELLKGLPGYDALPAVYLSIVGVDRRHQGRGIGSLLMADAFGRCLDAAAIVGTRFIVLDALNEDAARLYRRLGFKDLPAQPPRMLISLKQVRNAVRR